MGVRVAVVFVLAVVGTGSYLYFSVDRTPPIEEPGEVVESTVLSPEKQRAIWAAEHATFEIEKRFGGAFKKAWAARDAGKLAGFFLPGATGTVPRDEAWRTRRQEPLSERSRVVADSAENSATPTVAVEQLINQLSEIRTVERKKLRVLAIEAVDEQTWDCRFLLSAAGPGIDAAVAFTSSLNSVRLRFDNEKQLGTVPSIAEWRIESETRRSGQRVAMREITAELGLDRPGLPDNWELHRSAAKQHRFQFAVEDFDADGDMDVALMTVDSNRILLARTKKGFEDITQSVGLPKLDRAGGYRFTTAWIDFDNDGYPDLLSGSRLFHNRSGKAFVDVTKQSSLRFSAETMGCNVVDYNNDGLLDLYVLYQRPFGQGPPRQAKWVDESESGLENALWQNTGGGRFVNVTEKANAGGGKRHTHAAAWFFYDDDQYPDVYIANDFGRNVLLRNRGDGTFEDVSQASGSDGFATSMGVVAGDIDNDGTSDLYVANMFSKMGRRIIGMVSPDDYPDGMYAQIQGSCAGNRLYTRSDPTAAYSDQSVDFGVNAVGWAWGPTMFDANHDGWLDLYATSGFMSFDRKRPDG